MILGIDASNVRGGGGLSYFAGMMNSADPPSHGIDKVIVWAGSAVLDEMPERDWLDSRHETILDNSRAYRLYWQNAIFPRLARDCDIVFAPGSNAPFVLHPLVSLSQNILPFARKEMFRFGVSGATLRFMALRWSQRRTFSRSDGVIFLSQYAHDTIRAQVDVKGDTAIIPHGISDKFRRAPVPARRIEDCDESNPLRLLYVSIVNLYKHQWHVAEAVARLREKGLPVAIDFVGPSYEPALVRFEEALRRLDPGKSFLHYRGATPYKHLAETYHQADLFVFASSCENLPNIMIEAMSAGLPIASSKHPPMPEVLGNAGVYFDPENVDEMTRVLDQIIRDEKERDVLARRAYEKSLPYSWDRCAEQTMAFIAKIHEDHESKSGG